MFRVGDLMLIESHIDLFFRSAKHVVEPMVDCIRPVVRADTACDQHLIQQARGIGRRHGFALQQGVYLGLLGPSYETRAEYRMCRRIGADAVGMSTIPEIAVASAYNIAVLAVSIITNIAPTDAATATSGHAVLAAGESAAGKLCELFAEMLRGE